MYIYISYIIQQEQKPNSHKLDTPEVVGQNPAVWPLSKTGLQGHHRSTPGQSLGTAAKFWRLEGEMVEYQWVGLSENLQETMDSHIKLMGLSCSLSLKSNDLRDLKAMRYFNQTY